MINRPAHAHRTFELTRTSLQTIPAAGPAVGPWGRPGPSSGSAAGRSILGDDAPLALLVDLQRWRRKHLVPR